MWHDIFEIIEGLISVGTYIRGGFNMGFYGTQV